MKMHLVSLRWFSGRIVVECKAAKSLVSLLSPFRNTPPPTSFHAVTKTTRPWPWYPSSFFRNQTFSMLQCFSSAGKNELVLFPFVDMRKALSRDIDKRSVIPLKNPVRPDELEWPWLWWIFVLTTLFALWVTWIWTLNYWVDQCAFLSPQKQISTEDVFLVSADLVPFDWHFEKFGIVFLMQKGNQNWRRCS